MTTPVLNAIEREYGEHRARRAELLNRLGQDVLSDESRLSLVNSIGFESLADFDAGYVRDGAIAVVPVGGAIHHRSDIFDRLFYGDWAPASLAHVCYGLAEDDDVAAVLFDMHCPGGTAAGMAELCDALRVLAEAKPLHVISHEMIASNGYWVASFAHEIVGTVTSRGGSIGTTMGYAIFDTTKADEADGIRQVHIATGGLKAIGAGGQVSEEQERYLAEHIAEHAKHFFADVIENRSAQGVTQQRIDELQGALLHADQCVERGLFDRVVSYQTYRQELRDQYQPGGARGASTSRSVSTMPGTNKAGGAGNTPEPQSMTADEFREQFPDEAAKLVEEGRAAAEAEKPEPEQAADDEPAKPDEADAAVPKDMAGRDEFLMDCLRKRRTVPQIRDAVTSRLADDNASLREQLDKAGEISNKVGDEGTGGDPVSSGGGGGSGSFQTYAKAVDHYIGEGKTRVEAVNLVNARHPELRRKHLARA